MKRTSRSVLFDDMRVDPWGFEMFISAELDPGMPPRINDIDGGDPGWPASADVYDVRVGGVSIYEMLTHEQMARIERAALLAADML